MYVYIYIYMYYAFAIPRRGILGEKREPLAAKCMLGRQKEPLHVVFVRKQRPKRPKRTWVEEPLSGFGVCKALLGVCAAGVQL